MPKIGIIGDALAPNFNEANANQVYGLSRELAAPVLTGSDLGFVLFKRLGQYFILNTKYLRKKTPLLSIINGAFFYPFVKSFEKRFDTIVLPAGIDSGFLRYLDLQKCVLLINSLPFTGEDRQAITFVREFAPELRGIVTQSQRIRDRLIEIGVKPEKLGSIYPWLDLDKFIYSNPPDMSEFRILFASAPNDEIRGEDIFAGKGVPLLLRAFKELAELTSSSLFVAWRGCYNRELAAEISELGLNNRVHVINRITDMPGLHAQCHVTVIPFSDTRRSPEIPLSAVESLACGRPVVTTNVAEIAEIVQGYGCGCICGPTIEGLVSALTECKTNYEKYQANCRHVAETTFGMARLNDFVEFIEEMT